MNIDMLISKTITKQVLKSAHGRAFILNTVADAEDNGEAVFFEEAQAVLDDERFKKMVQRHQEDEIEHGRRFRARAEAQGVPLLPVPDDVKVLDHMDDLMNGEFSKSVKTKEDLFVGYTALQAIEERAITQFGMYEELFRPLDPETADVFGRVRRDEERHLRYCAAITRHLEPDARRREETLDRLRKIEAEAFARVETAMSRHLSWVVTNPILRFSLRTAARLAPAA